MLPIVIRDAAPKDADTTFLIRASDVTGYAGVDIRLRCHETTLLCWLAYARTSGDCPRSQAWWPGDIGEALGTSIGRPCEPSCARSLPCVLPNLSSCCSRAMSGAPTAKGLSWAATPPNVAASARKTHQF